MNEFSLKNQLLGMFQNVVAFLPNLLAGIVLILIGWLLAWLAKRIAVRIAIVLRLERYLTSFRWGDDFARADVRYGLYNFLGGIVAAVIFLIFLENAFEAWNLKLLSRMIEKGIAIFPRLFSAAIAIGAGWLISLWSAKSIQRTLLREHVPGATLMARLVKMVLVVFFSAIALYELEIGRQIVLIGFGAFAVTIGAFIIIIAVIGGRDALKEIIDSVRKSGNAPE
ncbi:conserved membrane hypothetical protein [Candidatus Zixiibacteriota bacterium]|nr:conserved membrane hypothetical protein [candidate division Zixibacteria bacterium]